MIENTFSQYENCEINLLKAIEKEIGLDRIVNSNTVLSGQIVEFHTITGIVVSVDDLKYTYKCLDVLGGRNDNNTPLVLFDINNTDNQRYVIEFTEKYGNRGVLLRAKHSNKYLGVLDGRLDPTAPIVQQDLYLDDARQIWTSQFIVQGSFLTHTINVHSGLVLDVFDNRTDNETPIIQFPVKQPVTFNQSFLWISVGFEN